MMLATDDSTPLTSVVRLFPVEVATLVLIAVVVARIPFTLLVSTFPTLVRAFEVLADANVTLVVATTPLIVLVKSPVEVA
jgi:hypothetical protein